MKNNSLKFIQPAGFFMALALIVSSCKKEWYDVKSDKSLTVPATLKDFQYLLNNYEVMNTMTPGLGEIGSDGHYMPESRWSTLSAYSDNGLQKNAYTWSNTFPYINVRDWNYGYQRIFYCNLILEGLPKINPADPAEQKQWNEIKGNALFHKAKNYYDLAQVYAQPFNSATAATDISIPLKDGIDVTESSTRSTVQQSYDRIISDLLTAKNLLPTRATYSTQASQTAIFALLARIYLTMENYDSAKAYADSCLNKYDVLEDYNLIPVTDPNLGKFNEEIIFFSDMVNWTFTFQTGYIFVETAFYNQYGTNDLRKTRFFKSTATGVVFKGMYNDAPLLFTGLATDEIYLTRAECYARDGKLTEALKDLNDLLITRWDNTVPYIPVTASTADEALQKILTERYKELFMRGLRWADLKRLNKDERFKKTITRTIGGQQYTLEPNSFNYTLPIPRDVTNYSRMQQNPGW
jgi:starch-binding outer membrane protein, SusD/RagB family